MGQFSWLDCKTGEQIVDNKEKTVYLLIPKEFGGGHYSEPCYDGYGHFGGVDVYEMVARWNRKVATPSMLSGSFEDDQACSALKNADRSFEGALKRLHALERAILRLQEFKAMSEDKWHAGNEHMVNTYGPSYLREIGINIAGRDEQNVHLTYPIKVTYDSKAVYETSQASLRDPNQGWED